MPPIAGNSTVGNKKKNEIVLLATTQAKIDAVRRQILPPNRKAACVSSHVCISVSGLIRSHDPEALAALCEFISQPVKELHVPPPL